MTEGEKKPEQRNVQLAVQLDEALGIVTFIEMTVNGIQMVPQMKVTVPLSLIWRLTAQTIMSQLDAAEQLTQQQLAQPRGSGEMVAFDAKLGKRVM